MLTCDSEMICWAETVVQKLKSEHTWYSKNKILETSNQMRDFAFQKTIAPPTQKQQKQTNRKND